MSVNRFIKYATLGAEYDPWLQKALLALNRELTAQGNNLNQIAKHHNSVPTTPSQTEAMLDVIGRSMLRTHKAVREALVHGKPEPSA